MWEAALWHVLVRLPTGMGSLVFTDDVTAERSSGMNVYTSVLHEHVQLNAAKPIGQRFTVPMANDLKLR